MLLAGVAALLPIARPILFVRLPNWVGDVCMSLPSLDAVQRAGCPVVVCARPWAADLLAGYPLAGFVPMRGPWREDRIAVLRARRSQYRGPALGLLLPDSLSSALTFRLAGVRCAGYRDDGRSLLLRWPCSKPREAMHAVRSWFHLTRHALAQWHLTVPPPAPPADLGWRATAAHEAQAQQAITQAGLETGRFVLIAPVATGRHRGRAKAWSGFDALTRALLGHDVTVAMAPPATERAAAQAAAPTARLLDPLGPGAFAVLARRAGAVVCNDSGAAHLAAAAGAYQVTLFGVTDPARTGPWSDRARCVGGMDAWPGVAEVLAATLDTLQSRSAA